MPILKISNALGNIGDTSIKLSYPDMNSNGNCIACEMPSTPDNPVVSLGETEDGKHEILSHIGCAPAKDRRNEAIDHFLIAASTNDDNIWAFADKLRNPSASTTHENSLVEGAFPDMSKGKNEVSDMTNKQVDANYDSSGTPVPPKN